MMRAVELSRLGFPAPNPHVGCVIVADGEVVGEGYHDHAGGPHAEIVALRQAGKKARGATVFVTMEPCNHHGRTPPCAAALLEAGVARVVAAYRDPIPSHSGGLERLRTAGMEVHVGLMEETARAANLPWLTAVERAYPYVVAKAAMTLDGRIAMPDGRSKWITGEQARAEAHRLRAECGAVLVGRATVEKDDPSLTVRHIEVVNQPLRIVLDPSRKVAKGAKIFDREAPSLRFVAGQPMDGEAAAPYSDGAFDLRAVLKELYARGVTSVLVEGGALTIGKFYEAGLIDRIELFVAPKVFGAGKMWIEASPSGPAIEEPDFKIVHARSVGNDAWISCVRTT